MIILETNDLSRNFGGLWAVRHLSIAVERGKITALIGPNGAGKTTIFNLLTGFLPPSDGSISLDGKRIDGLPPNEIARRKVARTFQIVRVFGGLSVIDNVVLGRRSPHGEGLVGALLRPPAMTKELQRNEARADELLRLVGLERHKSRLAQDLGYGEQKLVEIARALATDAELLLLDEPMAGLSQDMVRRMIAVMRDLQAMGKTILFVEHNMHVVMDISDHIFVVSYGEEIARGAPADIRRNKRVIEAYLGTGAER